MLNKREGYISWDEYFMWIAMLSAHRSKDPNTQVGACIVNEKNRIVGIGYNWFPRGCDDDTFPWDREWKLPDTKYAYVVHAEANAILNSWWRNLEWTKIYVALFPCNECAKLIIQAGIKEIVYLSDKYDWTDINIASKKILNSAWIKLTKLDVKNKEILIKLEA